MRGYLSLLLRTIDFEVVEVKSLVDVYLCMHVNQRADEKERIERLGGKIVHWGRWRVQGVLAVSRYWYFLFYLFLV